MFCLLCLLFPLGFLVFYPQCWILYMLRILHLYLSYMWQISFVSCLLIVSEFFMQKFSCSQTYPPLITFSFWAVVVSGHHCLAHDFGRNASSVYLISKILASRILCKESIPKFFYILSKYLSSSLEIIIFLALLIWCIKIF